MAEGIRVVALSLTPVKGLRLLARDAVSLGRDGVRDNRRFYLIDERDRMVNAKQVGELEAVVAEYDDVARRLVLTFPDGRVVAGVVDLREVVSTRFFSRMRDARVVAGPWAEALSSHVGQALRLVEPLGDGAGAVDRGRAGAASLVSRASLRRLEREADASVDPRRFRMLVEVDGVDAHAEDAWVGADVRVGNATVRFHGHVGRCLVTSRDPDTGELDLPTLDLLGAYRRSAVTTEPLAFGIYGEVVDPGVVRVGDPVVALDAR
jgi:MOSC domain-containing protein